jgi:hypothetical protein
MNEENTIQNEDVNNSSEENTTGNPTIQDDSNSSEHMIPKSRLDQEIGKRRDLESELNTLRKEKQDQQENDLAEQNKYKELWETEKQKNIELQKEIDTLKLNALRNEVAEKFNIPLKFADRISGTDKESLEKDAETLSEVFKVEPKVSDIDNRRSTATKPDLKDDLAEKQRLSARYGISVKNFD